MMDWSSLLGQARLFLLVFGRVVALLRTAPLTSSTAIPPLSRGGLAFFVALMIHSSAGSLYGPVPQVGLGYALALLAEVALGIIMGLLLQLVFAIFQTAGQMFSFQMGFGASQVYDPLAQIEIPLIGQFLNLVGIGVFLGIGGMVRIFVMGLTGSFSVMKGTDFLASSSFLRDILIGSIGGLFEQSLILAFPILGTLILISVTMGLLAKAAPQMNLLLVGFPLQIGIGFVIMLLATPFIAEKMSNLVDMGFELIETYLFATREALG